MLQNRRQLQWIDDQQRILLFHPKRDWSWTQLHHMQKLFYTLSPTPEHMVYTVLDYPMHTDDRLPAGNALKHIRCLLNNIQFEDFPFVCSGFNYYTQQLIEMTVKIYNLRPAYEQLVFVENLAEAIEWINTQRQATV